MLIKNYFRLSAIVFLFLFQTAFAQQAEYTRNRTFDAQNYTIRVHFDRASKTVFGDTTIQLKPLRDNFKTLELDAANLKFQSISLENQNVNLAYKIVGEKVIITLDKNYSTGDLISVRFVYSTARPKKGVHFVDAVKEGGETTRDAQIWSQGESEEAHFWFPCYDFPDDKATSEEFITVEKDETAIGNGELVETLVNADGTRTFHYKMPIVHSTYLISFVVGKYEKYSDAYKDIPLGFYIYKNAKPQIGLTVLPDGKGSLPTFFAKTSEMIGVYENLTGVKFPYNKYDQTLISEFDEFGGMENITATTLSDREIFETPVANVVDLVSHELAHSWFGDLVTCRNWAELWLNEGFATYMEAAYRERAFGREEYLREIGEDAREFMVADAVYHPKHGLFFAGARPNDELFNLTNAAVTYKKGGAVIHILRETVGADNFWRAVNIYLNRYKFQNVESKDLQRAMEEASGQNLDWFFAQWVYGAGYPKLSVKQFYNQDKKTLILTVNQTQKVGANVPAAFRLPLAIEIKTAKGVSVKNIELKKRTETFNIKIDDKPTNIFLDPQQQIPLKTVKFL